jgi:hypothetical protein
VDFAGSGGGVNRPGPAKALRGAILAADERFEVIVHDGLGQFGELSVTPRMKEDRMSAEAIGHSGGGRLGAARRSCDLSMARAGGESRGNGNEKRGALEIVGGRERLA